MTDILERLCEARHFYLDRPAVDVDERQATALEVSSLECTRNVVLLNEARAEIERLRAGGCARDQHTTQFCAELRAAVKAENEACARIIDPPKSAALTPEASTAKIMRAMLAEAIRARMEAKP